MKNWTIRLSIIFLAFGLVALIFAGVLMLFSEQEPDIMTPSEPQIKTGWHMEENGTYFYDDSGKRITGLFPRPQGTYYFDKYGKMVTGWAGFAEGIRYFNSDGRMNVGWLDLNGKRYCFNQEGLAVTGWQELQGQRYYFTPTGAMAVGWQETDAGKLFFDENGQVQTGWLHLEDGSWYLQEDGTPYIGWMQTETARHYFREDGKMATGMIQIGGENRLFSPDGNYIPLINAKNTIPEDYTPNLVTIENFLVDSTCVDALADLMADARKAGLICVLNSTYRDLATQEYLWNRRYNDYLSQGCSPEEAYALSIRRVMYPGASEHHSGLAIDIKGSEELYQWFREHAWEYGFHCRYPGEKEPFTGVRDEPWHLRYLGREVAQTLQERGLCLEEYFNELLA